MIEDVFSYLSQGKTVVIDLSLKDSTDASVISTILVRKLFEHNKAEFTSDKPDAVVETVIFVEEAQNVLSDELVRTNANPFVRCAKEGRKFKLGMVAITQRPSAISEEIRTQAENFFAFHIGEYRRHKSFNQVQHSLRWGNLHILTARNDSRQPIYGYIRPRVRCADPRA